MRRPPLVLLLAGLALLAACGGPATPPARPRADQFATATTAPTATATGTAVPGGMPATAPLHRTIESSDAGAVVDFEQCTADRVRVWVAFGSTTLATRGRDADACRLDFGGEVENPEWDGWLDYTCRVPARLGRVAFAATRYGLDLAPIAGYCREVS